MVKLPTQEDIDTYDVVFESYFVALGKVAHAWNHLQEELGTLFCDVTGLDNSMGMAVWQCLKSDRSQRDLLEAALQAAVQDDEWVEKFPDAQQGIRWLLNQANDLANKRNDAIHAPCSVVSGDEDLEIIAVSFSGNQRARKLRGKDILAEFAWYEDNADTLRRHAREIQVALSHARNPWPDKPRMPSLGQASSRS